MLWMPRRETGACDARIGDSQRRIFSSVSRTISAVSGGISRSATATTHACSGSCGCALREHAAQVLPGGRLLDLGDVLGRPGRDHLTALVAAFRA